MIAVAIDTGFGLENVALVERPEPAPGPGESLGRLRVRRARSTTATCSSFGDSTIRSFSSRRPRFGRRR